MVSWLARLVRARRLDRNPLRRTTDRLETVVLALLVAVFLAATPFATLATAAWAQAAGHQEQVEQRASVRQVPAVVQKLIQVSGGDLADDLLVSARWTAPDGKPVTGDVYEPFGTSAGSTIRVWVTRDGQVTEEPLLDSQVSADVIAAGAVCVLLSALLLAATGVLYRWALDKRRMADWESEWRAAGPRWTTRA